jgi:hypothetical protein
MTRTMVTIALDTIDALHQYLPPSSTSGNMVGVLGSCQSAMPHSFPGSMQSWLFPTMTPR